MVRSMLTEPSDLPKMGFGLGAKTFWRAIGYLFKHPGLFKYVGPSVAINGTLIAVLIVGMWTGMGILDTQLSDWEAATAAHWYTYLITALSWIYVVAKTAIVFLFLYFVMPPLYVIMMNLNPITAYLSSLTFKYVFRVEVGQELQDDELSVLQVVFIELRKVFFFLLKMMGALMLNFVPYIGTIFSAVFMFLINVQTSGWALLTPYYESLGYDYRRQKLAVKQQKKVAVGLGTMFELVLLIPIVNILTLFVGNIAGALVAAEIEKKRLAPPETDAPA